MPARSYCGDDAIAPGNPDLLFVERANVVPTSRNRRRGRDVADFGNVKNDVVWVNRQCRGSVVNSRVGGRAGEVSVRRMQRKQYSVSIERCAVPWGWSV